MSNHTFLLTTAAPAKPRRGQCPADGRLLMAAMSIPVFWYMLFDEGCLTLGPGKEDAEPPYLHLSTPTEEGLARAERRWPATRAVLGHFTGLFQVWCSFVREHARDYLHCETAEWSWMFDGPEAFEEELRTCLRAFDHLVDPSPDGVDIPEEWARLLGQAHVGFGQYGPEPLGNLSYCGFAFGYDVPWSEDDNAVCGVMSDRTVEAPAFSAGPEDLQHYMERVWSPIHEYRQAVCSCGGATFRLQLGTGDYDPLVRRTCSQCGRARVIGGEYFLDTYLEPDETEEELLRKAGLKDWACDSCGKGEANVGVGFEMARRGTVVEFMHVGQRCVACGRMGCCAGWEEWNGPWMFDEVEEGVTWDGERRGASPPVDVRLDVRQ